MIRGSRWTRPAALLLAAICVVSCSKSFAHPTAPMGGAPPELNSGVLLPGAVYQHTFEGMGGVFPYHCGFQPSTNKGTVVCGWSAYNVDSVVVVIDDHGFTPVTAYVKPGGSVRWIQSGTNPHTVTSD